MDTNVPKDPGAGVGTTGVKVDWENTNDKNAPIWNADNKTGDADGFSLKDRKDRTPGMPQRKNPWLGKNNNDGTDQNQAY